MEVECQQGYIIQLALSLSPSIQVFVVQIGFTLLFIKQTKW